MQHASRPGAYSRSCPARAGELIAAEAARLTGLTAPQISRGALQARFGLAPVRTVVLPRGGLRRFWRRVDVEQLATDRARIAAEHDALLGSAR